MKHLFRSLCSGQPDLTRPLEAANASLRRVFPMAEKNGVWVITDVR